MKRFLKLLLPALALAPAIAFAAQVPWRTETYSLTAREMNLRSALDTFAVAEGLPVVMSQAVQGVLSGNFTEMKPADFLEQVATIHNLTWYYDGSALYIYGAGEIGTLLLDLKYMKASEVTAMLKDLGVEDERFPLRTTSNDELLMVSGPPRYVAIVGETVAKADKLREMRTYNEVETRVFPLVNTWADNVSFNVSSPENTLTIKGMAYVLEEMMGANGGQQHVRAGGTNELSNAEESAAADFRPVIRPENRLNAVIVRDVKSRMPMYEELLRQLDVPQKLVEIGITVVELSRKDALDWQMSLKVDGQHKKFAGAAGQNAGNGFDAEGLGGKGLAGALTYLGSDVQVAASLSALKEKGKARSISRTSLLTVNNLAAKLSDTQSYHAKVVGTEVATLEEVTAGTSLRMKPRIVPSAEVDVPDQVWLSLELNDGGFESISVDAMPMTRSSTLQTQTAVFEDESIMLAGYLRDIEESGGWGIPFLRDLPLIGWIFGGSSTRKETVQRMFIISPHIVDLDTEMLVRAQAKRLRDITEEEKLQDDAEDSDLERRRRELERKATLDRRRDEARDELSLREAEVKHEAKMRQFNRLWIERQLGRQKEEWAAIEAFERARSKAGLPPGEPPAEPPALPEEPDVVAPPVIDIAPAVEEPPAPVTLGEMAS